MIRVLTCNLFAGRACGRALAELLRAADVDVVCTQETSEAQAAGIEPVLPHGIAANGVANGNRIAARRPVSVRQLEMPGRNALVARLAAADWPALGADIDIVNVHFGAPQTWPYPPRRATRARQLAALLTDPELADGAALAVLGDFNATPAWPLYRQLRERFDESAVERANGGLRTWPNLPFARVAGLIAIDHCLTRGLHIVSARTVAITGSDHRGLLVELALPSG